MVRKFYSKLLILFIFVFSICIGNKADALAYNILPVEGIYNYKTIYGAYVYDTPVIGAKTFDYLDVYTDLDVTGVTDTGFFQIKIKERIGYVSGLFVEISNKYPVGEEARKEAFKKIADAFNMQLETSSKYIPEFGIKDITGDGFPELIAANGKEIYSYFNEKPVMIYYSDIPKTFYYNKNLRLVLSGYSYGNKTLNEVLTMDYSVLPWGQLTCFLPGLAGQDIKTYSQITYNYTNNEETREKLGEILYSLYVAGSI